MLCLCVCVCVCRADIVVILTCVNSLLPWLGGVAGNTPSPVLNIHCSCELLVTMAILQSVSLQQLLSAISQLSSSREEPSRDRWVWLHWVEEHLQVLTPMDCATPPNTMPPSTLRKLLSMYNREDSSQWAELLQVR